MLRDPGAITGHGADGSGAARRHRCGRRRGLRDVLAAPYPDRHGVRDPPLRVQRGRGRPGGRHLPGRVQGRWPLPSPTATAVPWLLGIATRLAWNQQRVLARWLRVSRRGVGEPPRFTGEEYEAVEAAIDATRQAPLVQAALRAMPVRDREVLELVAYGQLSPSEAGLALGISPNAARLRLARARRRLRERLLAADPSAGPAAPTTKVSSHDL
jgi:RNA polymerase sigma factor (sigma-70 family)